MSVAIVDVVGLETVNVVGVESQPILNVKMEAMLTVCVLLLRGSPEPSIEVS